jgi:hypothetical protein
MVFEFARFGLEYFLSPGLNSEKVISLALLSHRHFGVTDYVLRILCSITLKTSERLQLAVFLNHYSICNNESS